MSKQEKNWLIFSSLTALAIFAAILWLMSNYSPLLWDWRSHIPGLAPTDQLHLEDATSETVINLGEIEMPAVTVDSDN